jgi:hypothetical protein
VVDIVSSEQFDDGGREPMVRYRLAIANYRDFPTFMFGQSPFAPACGQEQAGSRTTLALENATGGQIHFDCSLDDPSGLGEIVVERPADEPLESVTVIFHDRLGNVVHQFDDIQIPDASSAVVVGHGWNLLSFPPGAGDPRSSGMVDQVYGAGTFAAPPWHWQAGPGRLEPVDANPDDPELTAFWGYSANVATIALDTSAPSAAAGIALQKGWQVFSVPPASGLDVDGIRLNHPEILVLWRWNVVAGRFEKASGALDHRYGYMAFTTAPVEIPL